jgi:hypothetical protein
MTMFVRWKTPLPSGGYQYFEVAKVRWVDCPQKMVQSFLDRGDAVHMNPRFDPTTYLLAEAPARLERR